MDCLQICKQSLSVSINLSTRWQTSKKEGKFVRHGLVGVQRYGRGRAGRKQAKRPEVCAFQGVLLLFRINKTYIESGCRQSANPYTISKSLSLLVVDRLFRQSEGLLANLQAVPFFLYLLYSIIFPVLRFTILPLRAYFAKQ